MNRNLKTAWTRITNDEEGSQLVEFSLILIPLFMFVFAVISIAWLILAQGCLQNGTREAVRFAITHQADADIKKTLQKYAFGFADESVLQTFSVQYYTTNNLQTTAKDDPGNLVEISVQVKCPILVPFASIGPSVTLSADSSDVMEGKMSSSGS